MPRFDILLARNLPASRRNVIKLFRSGRVSVLGDTVPCDPKHRIAPAELPITVLVGERPVVLYDRYHVLQHKPIGVVTALRDARHPTAYESLHGSPLWHELRPVGRLDRMTSGLLLWTTEGALLHRITHPRYAVPRAYHVALDRPFGPVSPDLELDDGHRPKILGLDVLDPQALHPAVTTVEEARVFASITIASGRFHEVRRIFAALGAEVVALARVAFGPIELPRDLPCGHARAVDLHEAFAGLSPKSPP